MNQIIIHIAGPQGSGKTTLGKELKTIYRDNIFVTDLDDLYGQYTSQDQITNYQSYLDQFISQHNQKPLILTGLDADVCLGPKDNSQFNGLINTKYQYYLVTKDHIKQYFFRQIQKLKNRQEWFYNEWLKKPDKIQSKLFRYVDLNERKQNKQICDEIYRKKGYQFASYNEILQQCVSLLGQPINQHQEYEEHLSEPWFSLILLGLKTVEGRKNKGRFKNMKIGDIIVWKNNDFGLRQFATRIIDKSEYPTFRQYLETEGINNCLPGISDIESGLKVYYKYFTKEEEQQYGVVAINLELIAN